MLDPTRRFSSRVENYIKYRPRYPPAVLQTLKQDCGLTAESLIADLGSGTGILTELFLKNGNLVFAVEPNREMREAGERLLAHYPRFRSINGTAEATTLPDASVDFVTAAQAFHWFDHQRARAEFARILKPGGWVMIVWNERQTDGSPFLAAYEQLLQRFGTDYQKVHHTQIDGGRLERFFAPLALREQSFSNRQDFTVEELRGRLLSSSYTPEPGHPSYEPMLAALDAIFQAHQVAGRVAFEYRTSMYYGRVGDTQGQQSTT